MSRNFSIDGVQTREEQDLKVLRFAGVRYEVTTKRIVLTMPHRDITVADRYVLTAVGLLTVLLVVAGFTAPGGSGFGVAAMVVALVSPLWLAGAALAIRIFGEISMKQTVEMSQGGITVTREYPLVTNRVEIPYGQVRGVEVRANPQLRLVSQLLYRRNLGGQVEDCVRQGRNVVFAPVKLPVIDYGTREVFFGEYLQADAQIKVVEIVAEAVARIGAAS